MHKVKAVPSPGASRAPFGTPSRPVAPLQVRHGTLAEAVFPDTVSGWPRMAPRPAHTGRVATPAGRSTDTDERRRGLHLSRPSRR